MKITIELTDKQVADVARCIRDTTSDAVLTIIDKKSDAELVELAFRQSKEKLLDAAIISFPRRVEELKSVKSDNIQLECPYCSHLQTSSKTIILSPEILPNDWKVKYEN
jgi:3-deoxy-D-manno-octulosonic-acid transferase